MISPSRWTGLRRMRKPQTKRSPTAWHRWQPLYALSVPSWHKAMPCRTGGRRVSPPTEPCHRLAADRSSPAGGDSSKRSYPSWLGPGQHDVVELRRREIRAQRRGSRCERTVHIAANQLQLAIEIGFQRRQFTAAGFDAQGVPRRQIEAGRQVERRYGRSDSPNDLLQLQ